MTDNLFQTEQEILIATSTDPLNRSLESVVEKSAASSAPRPSRCALCSCIVRSLLFACLLFAPLCADSLPCVRLPLCVSPGRLPSRHAELHSRRRHGQPPQSSCHSGHNRWRYSARCAEGRWTGRRAARAPLPRCSATQASSSSSSSSHCTRVGIISCTCDEGARNAHAGSTQGQSQGSGGQADRTLLSCQRIR